MSVFHKFNITKTWLLPLANRKANPRAPSYIFVAIWVFQQYDTCDAVDPTRHMKLHCLRTGQKRSIEAYLSVRMTQSAQRQE